jgi:peptidoglycan/LPS O-acetylase OafA/YrhL
MACTCSINRFSGLVHGLLFNAVPDVNGLPQILASFLAFAIALGLAQISWLLVEAPIIDWVKRRRDNARASVELATPAPEVT